MRTLIGLGAFFLLWVATVGADTKDKKAKADKFDPAKLAGKWDFVSGEKGGEKVAADSLKKQKVTITKETITLKSDEATFVMKYEIDAAKSPVAIKMTMTESPFGAGAVAKGIVELDGDNLKLCYAAEGESPKKFETKGEAMHHLFVLKRAK